MDGGAGVDAGALVDAGVDAGAPVDAGVDAGALVDAGVDGGGAELSKANWAATSERSDVPPA